MMNKRASYGRIVFGASAVLFGIIGLLWRDRDTWQTLSQIWSLPFGIAIGVCLMILQTTGGFALLYPRAARWGAILLSAVYFLFLLAGIPQIIAAPATYGSYVFFFEQFSILCGAVAACAATEISSARALAAGRLALIGLGISTISFTLAQIFYLNLTVPLVPTWIPPNQMFWAIVTTIAFGLAAIAILINRYALLATRLLTLMLVLFGVLVWIPRLIAHPEKHFNWSEFCFNSLIMGACWLIADFG